MHACYVPADFVSAFLAWTCLARRYRVVPAAYRKAMPVSLKSHRRWAQGGLAACWCARNTLKLCS